MASADPEHRARKAFILAVCTAFFWLIVGVFNCYVLHGNGYRQLNSSLGQTVTAFSHSLNSRSELLGEQAAALAKDPRLFEPLPSVLELADAKGNADAEDSLQRFLQDSLANTDGDVLLLLNEKKQVVCAAERHFPSTFVEGGGADSAVSADDNPAEADKQVSVLPELGTVLDKSPVDAAFEFAELQNGYVCFKSEDIAVGVVVVPLLKDKTVKGAVVLGETLSDKVLGECSQGMMDGVLAVIVDHKVVSSYDKRTARRPAPLLLTSLENMVETWRPANTTQKITMKEGEPDAAPEIVDVAGRPWSALSMELSGGKHPVGWVLFLGDTSSVDDAVRYSGWFFLVAIGLFFPFAYFLAWKL